MFRRRSTRELIHMMGVEIAFLRAALDDARAKNDALRIQNRVNFPRPDDQIEPLIEGKYDWSRALEQLLEDEDQ